MLRTVMEMLHYPHLKFFVTLQKETQKNEKKRKMKTKTKNHLLTLFVKLFLVFFFSTYYPQFSFTHFFDLISERSECLMLLNYLNPKVLYLVI